MYKYSQIYFNLYDYLFIMIYTDNENKVFFKSLY